MTKTNNLKKTLIKVKNKMDKNEKMKYKKWKPIQNIDKNYNTVVYCTKITLGNMPHWN